MEKLSENIYKLYLRDKIKSIKNKSLYTLTCTMIIQSFIGNEKSFKFSFIVGFISALSGTGIRLFRPEPDGETDEPADRRSV